MCFRALYHSLSSQIFRAVCDHRVELQFVYEVYAHCCVTYVYVYHSGSPFKC